jgi:hypothetical protein
MTITVRELSFLLNILIDEDRGVEPIYVGIFGELPGEPYDIDGFDINEKELKLKIKQGVDISTTEEKKLRLLNKAIIKIQGE